MQGGGGEMVLPGRDGAKQAWAAVVFEAVTRCTKLFSSCH